MSEKNLVELVIGVTLLLFLAVFPVFGVGYWVSFVLTQTFLIGIAAASLVFLTAYGGMVSLAQTALYGISAFALGNMVTKGAVKGLHLGLDPWLAVVPPIAITTAIRLVFRAGASPSPGLLFPIVTPTS